MHLFEQNLLPFFPENTPPSYPTIVWLNFSQEHIRLPLSCKQTSSLLPIGWQDTSPLPFIQSDSRNSALQRGGRRGGGVWGVRAEREGDDRSRWGGRVNEGGELTHMWQDRAVLLMGREKYNNLKKGWWMWFLLKPHRVAFSSIYHSADSPDNGSAGFPA